MGSISGCGVEKVSGLRLRVPTILVVLPIGFRGVLRIASGILGCPKDAESGIYGRIKGIGP